MVKKIPFLEIFKKKKTSPKRGLFWLSLALVGGPIPTYALNLIRRGVETPDKVEKPSSMIELVRLYSVITLAHSTLGKNL